MSEGNKSLGLAHFDKTLAFPLTVPLLSKHKEKGDGSSKVLGALNSLEYNWVRIPVLTPRGRSLLLVVILARRVFPGFSSSTKKQKNQHSNLI